MQDDFGAELKRARTRKGLDINTVARRLRIRPDIIQAIEESDFERMPPRGYARNMINSYAHLLGLNASEITRSYLDAQNAYQVNSARKNTRGTGFDMPGGSRSRQSSHYEVSGYERGDLTQPRNARPRERLRGEERGGRRIYDDYDSGRIMERSEIDRTYRNAGRRSRSSALGDDGYLNAVATPPHTNTFSSRFPALQNLNWPLIAVVAAAAILLIVLLVVLLGPKGSSDDVSTMPVESASTAESSASSSVGVAAPTSFTFSFTVNSGASTWIEVYVDGKQEMAQNVEGPLTKTFTTSGELEFICADPSGVKATRDGKDVSLTPDADGVVDIKISFNDVLAEWQAEHGAVGTASSSSSSSSVNDLRGIDTEARNASSAAQQEAQGDADAEEGEDYDEDSYEDEGYDEGYDEDTYEDDSGDYYEDDSGDYYDEGTGDEGDYYEETE